MKRNVVDWVKLGYFPCGIFSMRRYETVQPRFNWYNMFYIISCWLTAVSVLLCTNNNNYSWIRTNSEARHRVAMVYSQRISIRHFPLEAFHILCPRNLDVSMAMTCYQLPFSYFLFFLFIYLKKFIARSYTGDLSWDVMRTPRDINQPRISHLILNVCYLIWNRKCLAHSSSSFRQLTLGRLFAKFLVVVISSSAFCFIISSQKINNILYLQQRVSP